MTNQGTVASAIRHDLFARLEYRMPQGSPNGPAGLQVTPINFVHKWIVQKSWACFSATLSVCDQTAVWSAKKLFNDAQAWEGYSKGVRQSIGRCLRYFVDHGMLPLHCINDHMQGGKLYVLVRKEAKPCL